MRFEPETAERFIRQAGRVIEGVEKDRAGLADRQGGALHANGDGEFRPKANRSFA